MENCDIKKYMESKREEMIVLEKILTCVPALSPENGGEGESEKVEVLKNWLSEHKFMNVQVYNAPDERVKSGVRPSVVVNIPSENADKNSPSVWVISHLDVVPTGELSLWNTNPFECVEKDGKLFGRGVEDNQQGLVSMTFAALYFIENKISPSCNVKLLFAADEECGSEYGIQWLMKNTSLFKKNDLVIIPDGGDSEGVTIEIAEKNLLWLKVHVIGKQTHGSRPDTGINANLVSCELALALHNMEKKFSKKDLLFEPSRSTFEPTMHLKNVDGINIIPGDETFYMDCRILPCYSIDKVMEEIDSICKKFEKKYGVKIETSPVQKSESPATKENSEVVKILSNAIFKMHGQKTKCIGIGGGTVGSELRRAGIDCAVWSTLDDMAHQPNEYCKIENIIKDAVTLAAIFSES